MQDWGVGPEWVLSLHQARKLVGCQLSLGPVLPLLPLACAHTLVLCSAAPACCSRCLHVPCLMQLAPPAALHLPQVKLKQVVTLRADFAHGADVSNVDVVKQSYEGVQKYTALQGGLARCAAGQAGLQPPMTAAFLLPVAKRGPHLTSRWSSVGG